MQDEHSMQVPVGHIPMTAPKKNPYRYYSFSNDNREIELDDACLLFAIIKRYLKRPPNNPKSPNNKFYDSEYILDYTIADVKFDIIKQKYSQKTYLKYFKHLFDIGAVMKVNADNRKCHKYYVNPDFHHRLESYNHFGLSQCEIYYNNYRHLWI